MDIGNGVGDFMTVGALAWRVYKSCKDTPASFKNLSSEILSLHAVLKEAEEVLAIQPFSQDQQARFETVLKGCHALLVDLQAVVDRYDSLGTQSRRTWDRIGWGFQETVDMRSRLTANIVLLSALVSTSQILVEKKLRSILSEFQNERREGSVITAQTVDSLCVKDRETWREIRKELDEAGITVAAFELNKKFIIDWLKKNLTGEAPRELSWVDASQTSIDDLSQAMPESRTLSPETTCESLTDLFDDDPAVTGNYLAPVEPLTLEIGNTHRFIVPKPLTSSNQHDWTFFVRPSRTDMIKEIKVFLHPTFRPSVIICTSPPYEVDRIGWGHFIIRFEVILKPGYAWFMQGETAIADSQRNELLSLEWPLDFCESRSLKTYYLGIKRCFQV